MAETFQQWVSVFGVEKLASRLGCGAPAVRRWIRREGYPKVDHMREIIRLSRGRLSYELIIESTRPVAAAKLRGAAHA